MTTWELTGSYTGVVLLPVVTGSALHTAMVGYVQYLNMDSASAAPQLCCFQPNCSATAAAAMLDFRPEFVDPRSPDKICHHQGCENLLLSGCGGSPKDVEAVQLVLDKSAAQFPGSCSDRMRLLLK